MLTEAVRTREEHMIKYCLHTSGNEITPTGRRQKSTPVRKRTVDLQPKDSHSPGQREWPSQGRSSSLAGSFKELKVILK